MGYGRYATQRSNRVRLKADCHAMLGKLLTANPPTTAEIHEMMDRLKPPTGAAAPIKLTGYTQMDKAGKVRVLHNGSAPDLKEIDWKAEGLFDPIGGFAGMRFSKPVDGMDERFGEPLDTIRYRKD